MSLLLYALMQNESANEIIIKRDLDKLVKIREEHTSLDGQIPYDDDFDAEIKEKISIKIQDLIDMRKKLNRE